jgi:hypothetical protein
MTAANESPPLEPPAAPADGPLVPVFVSVAVRTTAGPGPGVKLVPPAEASRLVSAKLAVHGERPPRGWPG